jgi:hypothetical protein
MNLAERNEAVIRRFYGELWNRWRLEVADEIVSRGLRFRGSLGSSRKGALGDIEPTDAYVDTRVRPSSA